MRTRCVAAYKVLGISILIIELTAIESRDMQDFGRYRCHDCFGFSFQFVIELYQCDIRMTATLGVFVSTCIEQEIH
jgi:hypothetical protein